jgi:hypothetical protein
MNKYGLLMALVMFTGLVRHAAANEVEIVKVTLEASTGSWVFNVTLLHEDTGWQHYADGWRIVDDKGTEIGYRKLWHPHKDEQPFTRALSDVKIPSGTKIIYVEAHDKVHGWSKQRVRIDLTKAKGDRYLIRQR